MSKQRRGNVQMARTVNAQYEDLRTNYLVIEREMLGDAVLEAASNAEESTKTGGEARPQSARPRTIEVCRSQQSCIAQFTPSVRIRDQGVH
jgi:hypothetical protein